MAQKTEFVVFIDAGVEAPWQLAAGVAPAAEAFVLSPAEDGIEQITAILADRPRVSVVAIVAHGLPGALRLGNARLDLETLVRYRAALQTWFLPEQPGSLYLYGCNVAAGDAGAEFLAELRSLTGANIAASPRRVGHPDRGGTWRLETRLGQPAPVSLLTPAAMASYPGVLTGSDTFAGATVLVNTDTGSNVGFTSELGEPIHDPSVSNLSLGLQQSLNSSAWWRFTATNTGQIAVNTAGSVIDTVLAVYTGAAVNGLTLIGSNNNAAPGVTSSSVTFTASAGTTYFFAVDGVGPDEGNITINLDPPPVITPGQSFAVSEGAAVGDAVGTVAASETGLTFTIDSGNPDNDNDGTAAFAIGNTGQITVQDADDLDFEAFPTAYTLQVTADDGGFSDTESVFIEVTDAAEPPAIISLTPSQSTLGEGSVLTLSGQVFDSDGREDLEVTIAWGDTTSTVVDGDDLVDVDGSPGNSTFSRNHTYADNGNFTVTVTVSDGISPPVTNTLPITVTNIAPTITQGDATTISLNEDASSTFQLSATDPSSADVLTWSVAGEAANGTVDIAGTTGTTQVVTYTPDANFSGTDSFQVQVTDDDGGVDIITVNAAIADQPDPPTAPTLTVSSDTIDEGGTLTLGGSFSDSDPGETFTITIDPGDGQPVIEIPDSDLTVVGSTISFSTDITFQDDTGGTTAGIFVSIQDSSGAVASASIPVTVNNVAPTVPEGPSTSLSVTEDQSGTITLTATDPADSDFTWTISTNGTNGVAEVATGTGASQEITYTPAANFSGTDEFTVAVDDGDGGVTLTRVIVGVDPENDIPTNLQITPSDPGPLDEGTTFTLSGSFEDIDNSAIAAVDDTHTVTIDWGDGTTDVLQDADLTAGDTLTPSFSGIPHTYEDEGTFTVEVTVEDAAGASTSVSQSIVVNNVAPVFVDPDGLDDGATTLTSIEEDDPNGITFTLTATDVGTDDTLTFNIVDEADNGTVSFSTAGGNGVQSFTYVPNANFGGPDDTFTIQVSDGDGGTDTLDITVPVTGVNDPPIFLANEFQFTEGEVFEVTTAALDAIDTETTDNTQIIFSITELAPGDSFFVSGVAQNTFSRADIIAGDVTFLGNGDEITPTFTITVTDGAMGSVSQPGNVLPLITVNDAPALLPQIIPITVSEGNQALVTSQTINATDEEDDNQTLTFTVSNLVAGEFLVNGTASTTFTLQEINQGVVFFSQDGSETPPSYSVLVTDSGNLSSELRDDVLTFGAVDDPPSLAVNVLTLQEGELVDIGVGQINAGDVDTSIDELVFSISSLSGGDFVVNGTPLDGGTFTQQDILLGNVQFQHDGSNNAPIYAVSVTDGENTVGPVALPVGGFTPINDAPEITIPTDVPPFTVAEGGIEIITNTEINATDEPGETPAADLAYTVSVEAGGFFANIANVSVPITTFSQADINASQIVFVHDGSNDAPVYTLTVDDGSGEANSTVTETFTAAITETNDPPAIIVNTIEGIVEGGTVVLSDANLLAEDEESAPEALTYTVVEATNGQFLIGDTPVPVGGTFTQADVNAGSISFEQTGENAAPSYTLTVTDGGVGGGASATSAPSSFTIPFTEVNDDPVLVVNFPAAITEGETIDITTGIIETTDDESSADELTYTFADITNATFQVSGEDVTSFTQADIDAGLVDFVHDGGEEGPSFTLTVTDTGLDGSDPATAVSDLIEPTFTAEPDPPVLVTNTLEITEGGTVTLGTSNLSAIDPDTPLVDLVFNITDITNGAFVINGVSSVGTASFSFAQLVNGLVSFTHDGSNTPPSYDVSVTDGDTATPPETVEIPPDGFTAVNDAPEITIPTDVPPFTVAEGQIAFLNSTNINATDQETTDSLLQYTVTVEAGGFFANITDVDTAITTFSQAEVNQSLIIFVHDGSDDAPVYTLTVDDGSGEANSTDTETFTAALTETNDPPVITTNTIGGITEGGTVVLTAANLQATDEESTAEQLVYTVLAIANGEFRVNDVPVATDGSGTFTQADVNAGNVTFVQTGENAAPSYTLTVTDSGVGGGPSATSAPSTFTIPFTAVNDDPVLVVNFPAAITEGELIDITTDILTATDEESSDGELTYTFADLVNGNFQVSGENVTSFTQADVEAGTVDFVHDGGEDGPSFTLTVTDAGLDGSAPATAVSDLIQPTFNDVPDAPELITNTLTISEGGTVILGTSNLSAIDPDTPPVDLEFNISNIANGAFVINGVEFTDTVNFTFAQLVAMAVSFVHDGSNAPPSYDVSVTDGDTATTPATVEIPPDGFTFVNDAPEITIATDAPPFTVAEGQIAFLNSDAIDATDEETTDSLLQYTVAVEAGGFFANITNVGTAITTFTQGQVNESRIVFVHDGSNDAPTYTLTVDDGSGEANSTTSETFTAALTETNDPPIIQTNTIASISEGETVSLTTANLLALDEESPIEELTFTIVEIDNGQFLVGDVAIGAGDTFTQASVNAGLISFQQTGENAAPSYTLTVTDSGVNGGPTATSAPSTFTVPFTAINDLPALTINFPDTINEGELIDITTDIITTTDEESSDAQLTYTFADLVNGNFQVGGENVDSFTQADIEAGLVDFVHDGSEEGPSFTLTVTDNGLAGSGPASVVSDFIEPTFIAENTPPEFTANQFSPVEGTVTVITGANLAATDEEDFSSQLIYSIDPATVTGGEFLLNGALLGAQTFNEVAINFGSLAFRDDDDETTTPGYVVRVTDTDGESFEEAAEVSPVAVNDPPVLVDINFTVTEGQPLTVNEVAANLVVQDVDSEVSSLTYTVSNPVAGNFFASSDPATPITTFTQEQADTGQVVFLQDGSETAPSFTLTLTDSGGASDVETVSVDNGNLVFNPVNDLPVAVDDAGPGLITNEVSTITFSAELLLANDIDVDSPTTSLSIASFDESGTQGTLMDNGDGTFTYDPSGAFDSLGQNERATDTFTYLVSDGTDTSTTAATVTVDIFGLSPEPAFFSLTQSIPLNAPGTPVPTNTIGGLPLAALFDENFYLSDNPDVAAAVENGGLSSGFQHFTLFGLEEGRDPSILFNEEFYLANNPGVAAAVANGSFASGLQHFLFFGNSEGRDPSTLFDQSDYLETNPDVATAVSAGTFTSGFAHYIAFGANENRLPTLSLFNEAFYLEANPNVAAAVEAGSFSSGFNHFVIFGQNEGRAPSSIFAEDSYFDLNPSAATSVAAGDFANGFQQYESVGRFQNLEVFA